MRDDDDYDDVGRMMRITVIISDWLLVIKVWYILDWTYDIGRWDWPADDDDLDDYGDGDEQGEDDFDQ